MFDNFDSIAVAIQGLGRSLPFARFLFPFSLSHFLSLHISCSPASRELTFLNLFFARNQIGGNLAPASCRKPAVGPWRPRPIFPNSGFARCHLHKTCGQRRGLAPESLSAAHPPEKGRGRGMGAGISALPLHPSPRANKQEMVAAGCHWPGRPASLPGVEKQT